MSRILIIDDNALVGSVIKEALEQAAYEVTVALDANQGYATAITFQPDLMLLDVHLPDLLGFDLLNLFKQRDDLKNIPIIMITGSHIDTQFKVRAFKSGVDDYVTKPFEMPELMERVAAVLRRSQNGGKAVMASGPAPMAQTPVVPIAGAPTAMVPTPSPHVPVAAPAAKTDNPAFVLPKHSDDESSARLDISGVMNQVLFAPRHFRADRPLPKMAVLYLLCANGLVLIGLIAAAGAAIKPIAAVLLVTGIWGLAISWIVIMSSLLDIRLGWAEGARLFSLAAIPLLLRLVGGCFLAFATTLSPFLFSAGPALFSKKPTGLMDGVDLFVLWTVYLCGRFLKTRDGRGFKAWIVAGGLWIFFLGVAIMARKFS